MNKICPECGKETMSIFGCINVDCAIEKALEKSIVNYNLEFCYKCFQMTNHSGIVCQKCGQENHAF